MKLWLATIEYAWARVANVVQAKFGRTTPRFEISTRLTDFSPEVSKRKNFWEIDCCCFRSEMAVDDVLTNCKKRVFKRPTWLVTCILLLILFCCCCCFCFCLFVFFRPFMEKFIFSFVFVNKNPHTYNLDSTMDSIFTILSPQHHKVKSSWLVYDLIFRR